MNGEFTLRIRLGNDAMRTMEDLSRAVAMVAREIERYQESGNVYDDNGNNVGRYQIARS